LAGLSLVLSSTILTTTPVRAQEWARAMFGETKHNFGTVAKGATTEHHFVFKNLYRDDVHISGVRTSCGCTSPIVVNDTVKSLETGEIIAHFNTDRFTGQRGATLSVMIDRPQAAEVQLRVDGMIRTDVVVNPGGVNFGAVSQGSETQQTVTIDYAGGQSDWQVLRLNNTNPYIDAKLIVPTANSSRRSYQVFVRLKENAPAGYLHDAVTLVTNDPSVPELPVAVEARVTAPLSVSPASLILGPVPSGQKITKQIVVQGKKPFRIMSIVCDDTQCFELPVDADAKSWHVLPIAFTGRDTGKRTCTLKIETDLPNAPIVEVPVHVDVQGLVTN
jgi:hypothetical protein